MSARLLSLGLGIILTGAVWAQTAPPEGNSAVLAGNKLEQSARCGDDAPLRITASDSRLSILGKCSVVRIEGDRNWIEIEHARRILATGSRNSVLYADRTTRIEDKGKANSLAERWPQ